MSLLVTFKLTGLVGQAQTIFEAKVLDVVTWERERPQSSINILDTINSSYMDKELSMNCSIFTYSYDGAPNAYGSSYMTFMINTTASFESGFATDLNVTFAENYVQSFVSFSDDLIEPPYFNGLVLTNMSFAGYANHLRGSLKAFAQFASVGKPNTVDICINGIDWFFQSPENRSHSMDVAITLTHYNGSVYKRIVQPFSLKMIGDDNDNFETAMELHEGVYSNLYLDALDYYKIYTNVGQIVRIYLYPVQPDPKGPTARSEINVYDPSLNIVFHKEAAYSNTIEFTSNSTGYWYVELRRYMAGFYSMEVTV